MPDTIHEFSKLQYLRFWLLFRQWIFPFLLLSAAIGILVSGIFNSFSLQNRLIPYHENVRAVDTLEFISVAVALMLLHGSYLLVMAHHLIYNFSLERSPGWSPIALAFICIAYWTNAVQAGLVYNAHELSNVQNNLAAAIPYFLFAPAYFLLAFHGLQEWYGKNVSQPLAKTSMYYFFFVDLVFGVLFFKFGIESLSQKPQPSDYLELIEAEYTLLSILSTKDFLIALVLIFYVAANRIVTTLTKLHKNIDYEEYLRHTLLISPPGSLAKIGEIIGSGKSWFDYGSGNGHRLRELLELAFVNPVLAAKKVCLYDVDVAAIHGISCDDQSWFQCNKITTELAVECVGKIVRYNAIANADVMLLSHLVYNATLGKQILQEIDKLKSGAFVVIRATGATGMFRVLSVMNSRNVFKPSFRHSVPLVLLRQLQDERGFELLATSRIKQIYDLTNGLTTLCTWCDIRYGEGIGSLVKSYLKSLRLSGVSKLQNDDDLYVLRKIIPRLVPVVKDCSQSDKVAKSGN